MQVAWCRVGHQHSGPAWTIIYIQKSKQITGVQFHGFSQSKPTPVWPHPRNVYSLCNQETNFLPPPPLSLQLLTPLKGDHLTLQLEISLAHKNGTAYYTYIFVTDFFFKNFLFERSIHMRATGNHLFILLMHRTHCISILSVVYSAHSWWLHCLVSVPTADKSYSSPSTVW